MRAREWALGGRGVVVSRETRHEIRTRLGRACSSLAGDEMMLR